MPERIHAPDLTSATAWLNVDRPIAIRELRGHVVILDFWTYCCVNCMHVLAILRDLEERHANDPVVVIGVHSAKFDAEKDAARIEAAMQRHGVSHPVAVDGDMRIWSEYAVRSWPTLVVIRPDGTLAAVAPGEPEPAMLEALIADELDRGRKEGTLARSPFHPRGARRAAVSTLSYPGKVAATSHGRIVVSDSGHHRVLVLGPDGAVQDTIGSGLRGAREGPFAEAALDDPQGVALDGDSLYIADARAHAVFVADLQARELRRLAGTFELGRTPLVEKGIAKETTLRSPWDLALRDHELYVALAGSHQIAMIDLREGTIEPVAGNGREALIDGPGKDAALAQPSGLSLQGGVLYIADSESSGVRAIDLRSRRVYTLAGGPGLFDFGDEIGPVRPGMLQHPLAVAATASQTTVRSCTSSSESTSDRCCASTPISIRSVFPPRDSPRENSGRTPTRSLRREISSASDQGAPAAISNPSGAATSRSKRPRPRRNPIPSGDGRIAVNQPAALSFEAGTPDDFSIAPNLGVGASLMASS